MSLLHSVVAWVRGWHESNFGMGGMGGKDQNLGMDVVGPQNFYIGWSFGLVQKTNSKNLNVFLLNYIP